MKKIIKKIKKDVFIFLLVCIELFIIYIFRHEIIGMFSFFNQPATNYFDNTFIGILASILLSILQFLNIVVINLLILGSRKITISFFQHIFKYNKTNLKQYINQMLKYVFSTKCKWGVTRNTDILKNANTAEGLIACGNALNAGLTLTPQQHQGILSTINRLIDDICEDGYKSYNENAYTVHCTGMVLFAIKMFIDLDIYQISEEDYEKIRACLKKMLKNANEYGWGFRNQLYQDQNYNRTVPTIWALRALNIWGFSEHMIFKKVLNNLIGESEEGKLGFSIGSAEKYSATGMLYLLVNEIKTEKVRKSVMSNLNSKKTLRFLLNGLKTEIEVEEFLTSINESKKLSWTHFSECIILESLALYINEMSLFQILKLSIRLNCVLKKIEPNQHFYIVKSMNFKYDDPFFYPTTYLISSLCSILKLEENNHE